jgi:hypothetical protein
MSDSRLLFVSFAYKSSVNWGYGSAHLVYPSPLKNVDDIDRLADLVKEARPELNNSMVVILYWQRMETW